MTPYERLELLHDEGRLLHQELTAVPLIGINVTALLTTPSRIASWTSKVRAEMTLVAPDYYKEWLNVVKTPLTPAGLMQRLRILGGIMSRLKAKENG